MILVLNVLWKQAYWNKLLLTIVTENILTDTFFLYITLTIDMEESGRVMVFAGGVTPSKVIWKSEIE